MYFNTSLRILSIAGNQHGALFVCHWRRHSTCTPNNEDNFEFLSRFISFITNFRKHELHFYTCIKILCDIHHKNSKILNGVKGDNSYSTVF